MAQLIHSRFRISTPTGPEAGVEPRGNLDAMVVVVVVVVVVGN
jgi:hypothetical protein